MASNVSVRILDVNCHNKESGGDNWDAFILLGAVIADGKAHGFGFETVALKSNSSFPYQQVVFDDIVESAPIGLALSGWETDRSADWYNVREDAKIAADIVGEGVGYLPLGLPGAIAAEVIKRIPEIIDFFDELDTDDNIFKWAGELPVDALIGLTVEKVFTFHARGRKEVAGLVELSDWDYEITASVSWHEIPGLWPVMPEPKWTMQPLNDAKVEDWYGSFANGSIVCSIGPSSSVFRPLRIQFFDEAGKRHDIPEAASTSQTLLVRRSLTDAGLMLEPVGKPVPSEREVSNAVALLTEHHHPVLIDPRSSEPVISDVFTPIRLRIGGDRVALPNGGIFELCETLANGAPTGGRALRYVRPATIDLILQLASPSTNLYLEPVPNI